MNISDLLKKPLWQMTGEEFMFPSKTASQNDEAKNHDTPPPSTSEKKYVYGIDGIAEIFGCSRPTAYRIKKSGRINAAIRQPFDEIKHRHTLNEVGDVTEGRYEWKIEREVRGSISL